MKTDFISLRLDTKTSTTVKKLIELRLVKTKTNAVKFIMKRGIMETTHIIERTDLSSSKVISDITFGSFIAHNFAA